MMRIDLSIQMEISGPLLSQSSEPGHPGHDMVVARDEKGIPYVPGSLITGKVNQALHEIRGAVGQNPTWFDPKIDRWLGETRENTSPRRKQLFFTDFVLKDQTRNDRLIRNRIAIDRSRGAVKKHQNVIIEAPFDAQPKHTFASKLIFFTPSDAEASNIIRHVKAGLLWLDQVGALRSVGFGRIENFGFFEERSSISAGSATVPPTDRVGFKVIPDQPFCLAEKLRSNNLFESGATIPGGAILGCIATTWSHLTGNHHESLSDIVDPDRTALRTVFNLLRITHAHPSAVSLQRPVVAPLSLTKIEEGETYDVALLDGPCLIKNRVPEFAIDWKDDSDVKKDYGWPTIHKQLRVRTAIQPETLRSADEKLFAYEQILHDELSWYAELDLSLVPEEVQPKVLTELRSLLEHGVIGLGKTKTTARIEFLSRNENPVRSKFPSDSKPFPGNLWVVTLQSDTLLGSPEKLDESITDVELYTMYSTAWHDLSEGNLTLLRYFARQKLAGSEYFYRRFQKGPYKPYLLTEAGSVFVLRAGGDPEKSQNLITAWLKQGLPITGKTRNWYGIDDNPGLQWQSCPYIPQNGYGEIAVNLPTHQKSLPDFQKIDILTENTELHDESIQ